VPLVGVAQHRLALFAVGIGKPGDLDGEDDLGVRRQVAEVAVLREQGTGDEQERRGDEHSHQGPSP
jgi:hypothetical protein